MDDTPHPDLDRPATAAEIEAARNLNACTWAIHRLESGTSVRELIEIYGSWLLLNAADRLTPAQLDWCAKTQPVTALKHAAHLLTPKRLDWCAERYPLAALEYAADRISAKRLEWCAEQKQKAALQCAALGA